MEKTLKELKEMLAEIQTAQNTGKADTTKHQEEITSLSDRIKAIEEALKKRSIGISLNGVDEEKEKFSFHQAIKGILNQGWGKGFEKRIFEETREKALEAGNDPGGGFLVPQEVVADFIELLRANTFLDKVGVTVINNAVGNLEIDSQEGGATAFWIGEGDSITASDPSFGMRELKPRGVAGLTKVSNRLLKQTSGAAEQIIRNDLARVLALRIDLAALKGTGGKQPVGISNTTGITDVEIDTNGGRFDFEQAENMVGALDDADALRGNLNFVTHPIVKRRMKQERIAQFTGQTDGAYVILPMSDAVLKDTLGWDLFTTTQVPINLTKGSGTDLSEVYFGNWAELIQAIWGGMELLASNVAGDSTGGAMTQNQTWIRALIETDFVLRHKESFALINDATTT